MRNEGVELGLERTLAVKYLQTPQNSMTTRLETEIQR